MEKISSTMVIHKNVYGVDAIFSILSVPLVSNTAQTFPRLIRIGAYQAYAGDSRSAYEPVSYLWPNVETDSDSRNVKSEEEGIKYQ